MLTINQLYMVRIADQEGTTETFNYCAWTKVSNLKAMDVREQIKLLNFCKGSKSLIMPSTFHVALTEKEMLVILENTP